MRLHFQKYSRLLPGGIVEKETLCGLYQKSVTNNITSTKAAHAVTCENCKRVSREIAD